jgi:hypothetical protein
MSRELWEFLAKASTSNASGLAFDPNFSYFI